MIQDSSAMDQPITTRRPLAKKLLLPGALLVTSVAGVAFVAPWLAYRLPAGLSSHGPPSHQGDPGTIVGPSYEGGTPWPTR